jgi:formate dehydrogenase iron-sulfur subunit
MSYLTSGNTTGLAIRRMSASRDPMSDVKGQEELGILVDVSSCTGCKACEVACIKWHDLKPPIASAESLREKGFSVQSAPDLAANLFMLMSFQEAETERGWTWFIAKHQCMHCHDPGCLAACPAPGAIVQYANGVVDFDQSRCIGCGLCRPACPFDIPRFDANEHPFKCNFCLDRVGNGMVPACAKACPTNALHFGTRSDMVALGQKVVAGLKERGYRNAALYDAEGVGGAGYVYALPHGDMVGHYGNLPKEPAISSMVHLWKGPLKWIGGAAILVSVAAMALHLVTAGPKTVEGHAKEGE